MLSRELEASLNAVAQEASTKRHEFVTVEHLLLALTNNEEAISVLKQVGADVELLNKHKQRLGSKESYREHFSMFNHQGVKK